MDEIEGNREREGGKERDRKGGKERKKRESREKQSVSHIPWGSTEDQGTMPSYCHCVCLSVKILFLDVDSFSVYHPFLISTDLIFVGFCLF